MTAKTFFDEKRFLDALSDRLSTEMIVAAEPLVKEAVRKAEVEMRKRLAEMVVGMVASSYDVYRDGQNLMIRVHMEPKK